MKAFQLLKYMLNKYTESAVGLYLSQEITKIQTDTFCYKSDLYTIFGSD